MDKRICPFMTEGNHPTHDYVICQEEKCMAWGEIKTIIDEDTIDSFVKMGCKLIDKEMNNG